MTASTLATPGPDPLLAAAARYRSALADIPEILELAADACRSPMAALKIADSATAHFAVTLGIPAAASVPKSMSLCDMVSAVDDTMVVDDASRDPRVASHPLVAGDAHVRFLAAAPLHFGRRTVGALCVFDTTSHPHESERTHRLLGRLARRIDRETHLGDRLAAQHPLDATIEQDDVITAISHELRTPLAAIRGNLELLSAGGPATGERRLDAISRNTDRLCRTVDSLLRAIDYHRADPAGHPCRVDLADLVSIVLTRLSPAPGRIRLCLPEEPVWATADPRLAEAAVEHLISNALIHGDNRPALVTVDGQPQPTLEIHNHGPGLDATEQAQVGSLFFRGSHARGEECPGLGLGLALSHRIITAQGGALAVFSTPGDGTTTRVVLPPAHHA